MIFFSLLWQLLQPFRRRAFGGALVLIILTAPFICAAEESPQLKLTPPKLTLSVNGGEIVAEVAATPAARRLGLSHRPHLPAATGMLLVFDKPRNFCLWMRDVSFPLAAVFIDSTADIIAISYMSPHTKTLHCTPKAVAYALEISPDWRQKYHLAVGDKVLGLPAAD